ncbi:MAG: hypothetical protein AAGC60_18345 [Acidobacteriota bacterium]
MSGRRTGHGLRILSLRILGLRIPGLRIPGLRTLGLRILGLLLALGLSGCVQHRMHRPDNVVHHPDGYTQAFLEIDDHGELWSPMQLVRILELLDEAQEHPDGALVNIFVHGWNNDASLRNERGGGNVADQQELLRRLVRHTRGDRPDNPRPVLGVYVAWRGRSLVGPLNFLTFYGRRRAAVRVAGITATSSLYSMLGVAKRNPRSRVVLIGHSFGGLVVERTLAQALIGAVSSTRIDGDEPELSLPADLIVLLNPASSSLVAKQFVEAMERNRLRLYRRDPRGVEQEMPLVVSITSTADWATGLLYPLGLHALALGKSFRSTYGDTSCGVAEHQRSFATRTAGHHPVLHSHEVTAERLPRRSTPLDRRLTDVSRWEFDAATRQRAVVFDGEEYRYRIRRKPRAFNDTPYWIMQVPESLIPDHNQVFGLDLYLLIAALMHSTGALEPDFEARLVREDGIRPIGIASFGDDNVLVLDRSRRLFSLEDDLDTPRLLGCLPPEIDPRDGLGFDLDGDRYLSAIRRTNGERELVRVVAVRFDGESVRLEREVLVDGARRFGLVAFDVPGQRAFLVPLDSNEIWIADVSPGRGRTEARLLTRLDGFAPISVLRYRVGHDSLFAADGTGTLYEIDLSALDAAATPGAVSIHRIGTELGWPTALAYDEVRDRLYAADAQSRRILRIDCAGGCAEPRLHMRCDELQRPSALRVLDNGELWIGDMESEALVRVGPSGRILRTFRTLFERPRSAGSPADGSVTPAAAAADRASRDGAPQPLR